MASLAERFETQVGRTGEHHRWLGARILERGLVKHDGKRRLSADSPPKTVS